MVSLEKAVEYFQSALTDLLVPDTHDDVVFEFDEHLAPGG